MERKYEIEMEVGGHRKEREGKIIRSCMVEWGFGKDDFDHVRSNCGRRKLLRAAALSHVSEGERIEDIVERIERAVWRANGGMCHVECHVSQVGEVDGHLALLPYKETDSLVA
jgi:hypothetical protein